MDLHLLPRGKTDFAQPIDAGFGRVIKLYMSEEMEKWLDDDDNLERWESNALSASHRRILLTHWFGDAFIKRAPENWDQVTKYWKHTGCLMTINGRDFGSSKLKFEGVSKENLHIPDPFNTTISLPTTQPDPELEDVAPFRESADEVDSGVGILDDEDNEDDEDLELAAFPDGITRLAAPEGAALEVGSQALVGKAICFSWTAVGWCLGIVVRHNTETDRRRKINGKVINHVMHYEIDDEEADHVLELDGYGEQRVLAEEAEEAA